FSLHAPATTSISTLSLHDALPISLDRHVETAPGPARPFETVEHEVLGFTGQVGVGMQEQEHVAGRLLGAGVHLQRPPAWGRDHLDRKSTRLNSSHLVISYAVFCLK